MHTATPPSTVLRRGAISDPSPADGPPLANTSFAGLLAKIAAPQGGGSQGNESPWNDDFLQDDVATIRSERVLRSHPSSQPESAHHQSAEAEDRETISGQIESPVSPKLLKTASITIRLSEQECAQVRLRAAEAGMTISAYLRSCTLEVESLRSQVKQTLSEIRSASRALTDNEVTPEPAGFWKKLRTALRGWFHQFHHPGRAALRLNRANPFAPVNEQLS